MRASLGYLLFGVLFVVSACATAPSAPPSVNVTGNWAGTWSYENPTNGSGELRGAFQQDGAKVSGRFNITGPVQNRVANNLVGLVSGNEIQLQLPSSGRLTVNGDVITGYVNGLNTAKLTLRKQP
ncbi:MAG TPA: hypothetical protein VJX92_11595 [Methylomirabilota bacterium]|nr:hypothetical protein [Methylomirabilota bacterium]